MNENNPDNMPSYRAANINRGAATICAGYNGARFGWFIPGGRFTTSRLEAIKAADAIDLMIRGPIAIDWMAMATPKKDA